MAIDNFVFRYRAVSGGDLLSVFETPEEKQAKEDAAWREAQKRLPSEEGRDREYVPNSVYNPDK